jgi:hypothetical protein
MPQTNLGTTTSLTATPNTHTTPATKASDFMLVTGNRKSRNNKSKANTNGPTQINLTPTSYVGIAMMVANVSQALATKC